MDGGNYMKRKITAYKIFSVLNVIIMLLIIFITAYPLYHVVMASFSDASALSRHTGALWAPLKPYTAAAYELVFDHALILSGFRNTFFIVVVGVAVNMVLTMSCAFFLTIKGPMFTNIIATMIIFTMYFGGGMVPVYLNLRDLGLLNSLWSLILPGAITTSNMIIMKSAFQSIPDSLVESARLDGASYWQILIKIMIPLSKATIAVLILYYGVAHWNAWFNASIYIQDSTKFPLQLVTRNILNMMQVVSTVDMADQAMVAELMQYALIVVTTTPIMILYPFLQKYFTKGVMIGAVKG